jgi:pantoate kinase
MFWYFISESSLQIVQAGDFLSEVLAQPSCDAVFCLSDNFAARKPFQGEDCKATNKRIYQQKDCGKRNKMSSSSETHSADMTQPAAAKISSLSEK